MPLALLAILALGLGGGALALGHKSAPPPATPLTMGKWYKVTLKASGLGGKTDALAAAFKTQGFFAPAILVSGPSDASAIGFFQGATGTHLTAPAPWSLVGVQEVNAPPQSTQALLTPPVLDPNLPAPTAQAVTAALNLEKVSAALSEFSSTLLPEFPAAAAILKTHAALLTIPSTATSGNAHDLGTNEGLTLGQSKASPNGKVKLTLLKNGDLQLLGPKGLLWASGTANKGVTHLWMGWDGNLRLQTAKDVVQWQNGTGGYKSAHASVQDDGNFVVYADAGNNRADEIWDTGTYGLKKGSLKGAGTVHDHHDHGPLGALASFASDASNTIASAAHDVGHFASDVAHDAGAVASALGSVVKAASGADLITSIGTAFLQGKSLGEIFKAGAGALASDVQKIAPYVESVIAVIPGIGSETASAIALGVALAEGKNITDAAIDALAAQLPGGALANEAFKAAKEIAKGIVQGKPLDAIAMNFVKDHVPAGPAQQALDGALALAHGKSLADAGLTALSGLRAYVPKGPLQNAFDSGMSLAHGQSLQQAGFNAVKDLLPGDAASQSLAFAKNMAGKGIAPITNVLEGSLKSELTKLGPGVSDAVHKAVGQIVSNPILAQLSSGNLAKKLALAEPIARAALASVSVPPKAVTAKAPAAKTMVLVKTARMQRLLPGPVSKPKVALATVKLTLKLGPTAMLQGAAAQSAAGNTAKAEDMAKSALLVRRAQLVAHYLGWAQAAPPGAA